MESIENVKYCHVGIEKDKSFFFDHVHIVWNEQITIHQSNDWELSYVIIGSGTRVVGDNMETFSKGEIILLPPNLAHGWYFDENVHDKHGKIENITIIFPDSFLDKCANTFPELVSCIKSLKGITKGMSLKGELLSSIQRLMYSMTLQNNLEQLTTLLQIISHISSNTDMQVVGFRERQSRNADKLQEVHRYMLTHYHDKITLDDVAKYVGMNSSSFCSFFKREKGTSFFTALNEYRIKCSCIMLQETSMTISEICAAVGFNDIPYFNRTFKKIMQVSPKEFRSNTN
ncbi:AraC family transcriptional regulator [Carboxylicivirga linearis]|uniref:Helix-turn-helix domain-containing protein n=1 Tax=Carboxylicivirga linearis TaxID=1628157 RepID=A0ABS5K1H0_9BACT|nr:helix-turn-helix domain-containing protein [Carboxylicivirga linearis]MBS2100973.1 helix-turn-helix domain-containing protein [Carboxylicivirga linearis]